MLNKKKLFQIILFSFGILIIFLTYFSNFQKKSTVKEVKEEEILNQEFLLKFIMFLITDKNPSKLIIYLVLKMQNIIIRNA